VVLKHVDRRARRAAGRKARRKRLLKLWGLVVSAGVAVGLIAALFGVATGAVSISDYFAQREKERNPLRVDFHSSPGWLSDGIVTGHFDPSKDWDYYQNSGRMIYPSPHILLEIESQGEGTVNLAPYLVVAVTDIEPIPRDVNYIVYPKGPGGAGGVARIFHATFSPERDRIFGAPQVRSLPAPAEWSQGNAEPKDADFFTLAPGQDTGEVFILRVPNTIPGYYYRFRVGIQYSYDGVQDTLWLDKEFVAGVPEEAKVWGYHTAQERFLAYSRLAGRRYQSGVVVVFPTSPFPPSNRNDVIQAIGREERAFQEYPSPFTLPKEPPSRDGI
jgi:hypothetical protein